MAFHNVWATDDSVCDTITKKVGGLARSEAVKTLAILKGESKLDEFRAPRLRD